MPWPEIGSLAIPAKMIVSPLAAPTSPGEERQQRLDSGLEVAPERGVAALRQYP
jgi:hypothetical protein